VIARLRGSFRCIAPDLLGLGDTEAPSEADVSVRAQARMILALLDALGVARIHVIGHDQGGAIAEVLAADHPERVGALVLCNAEAYDNWPSAEELPFVRLTQLPALGRAALWFLSFPAVTRIVLAFEKAVHDARVLTPDLVRGYVRANTGDAHRRAKTRRYLGRQLDPANRRSTLDAVDGLRRFDHPTLLVWGKHDPHFGPAWGERLLRDIPGARRLELLDAGHLVMEERPGEFVRFVSDFLSHASEPSQPPGVEARS
jgi:pimeloyl-ACP methyl ester carboxylesterase